MAELTPSVLGVLAAAARALHGEQDVERALDWTLLAIADVTGLPEVAICMLPRHGSPTWTIVAGRVDFSPIADPRTEPLLRTGIDTGAPIALADLVDAERKLPPGRRLTSLVPLGCLLAVPIMARDGLAQGVLFAGGPCPVADEAKEELATIVDALVALAAHVGVAVDNSAILARMAEVEARGKEVVHALQDAVRPSTPVVPFTELGVHYVAADPSAPTGGDLYDWITLPDGRLHFVVVDVMGKGVEATKHALSVTHALRLLAVEGCPLGDLVARADALVTAQNPELVATLLAARYDPDSGDLELVGAGHPPALLVHRGRVTQVFAPGIPIGWPGAASHEVVCMTLDRSDTLVFYTDGLIEATKDIVVGLETLTAAAEATSSYPATSLARALVERQLADAARHDDSLALVLRRRSPAEGRPPHPLGPFVHQFSPQAAAVPLARHLLRDWLRLVPIEDDAIDPLLLAVSELCSNAVRHATGAPGSVQLRAWVEQDDLHVEVGDDGGALAWTDLRDDDLPDPEAEQGRGLFLVRELADEVDGAVDDGRTLVHVVKRAVVERSVSRGGAG